MRNKNQWFSLLVLLFKGVMVGFGAILPGVSGGALCVAFGMYGLVLDLLSNPFKTLKQHWLSLGFFILGGGIGFIGLSGVASWLLDLNAQVVTCVFVGFIFGTVPELWQGAGKEGRGKSSYISLALGFSVMLALLLLLTNLNGAQMETGFLAYLFCGVMWGMSFIVPGLSSSTLLLFFGLYQPMMEGISHLSMSVLIPLALGVGICVLVLPRGVKWLYSRWYAILSHTILGIVLASTISIYPTEMVQKPSSLIISIVCIICGFIFSYLASILCARLEKKAEQAE